MRPSRRAVAQGLALLLAGGAAALLGSTFLIGSTPDEEEFRFAVLSAWLRFREPDSWHWTMLLGLGVPQPFQPNFCYHPLAPLLAVMPPVAWVRLLLAVHTAVGAAGMWRLCARLGLSPVVIGVCTGTFLLASASHNYVITDFWPSHFIVWTTLPWLLLLAWRVLDPEEPRPLRPALWLGLAAGLAAVNTNPGHLSVHVPIAAGLLLAHAGAGRRRWMALAAAVGLALAVASPNLLLLAGERQLFSPDLGLSNLPDPLPLDHLRHTLLAPFVALDGSRTLFFGGPFAVLALVGAMREGRRRLDLIAAGALAMVALFSPWPATPLTSARYQFRDPVAFCGIVLAGIAASRLLHGRAAGAAGVLLAAQVATITAASWPFLTATWQPEARQAVTWRGATADTVLADALVRAMDPPGRLLFSPGVDFDVSERGLVADGLGVNALAYRGVPVVNAFLKGISAGTIWPDDRLFYGRIRTPPSLTASAVGLARLGIRYVLAWRGEPVAPELVERWSATTVRGRELVLYEHQAAGPGAFLVDADVSDAAPISDCGHERLLCRELAAIEAVKDPPAVSRTGGSLEVSWRTHSSGRVLVIADMHRPEWTATAGDRDLATRAVFGGLIGVALPPGVTALRLEHRHHPRRLAAATSLLAVALALLALLGMRWRAGAAAGPQRGPAVGADFSDF